MGRKPITPRLRKSNTHKRLTIDLPIKYVERHELIKPKEMSLNKYLSDLLVKQIQSKKDALLNRLEFILESIDKLQEEQNKLEIERAEIVATIQEMLIKEKAKEKVEKIFNY